MLARKELVPSDCRIQAVTSICARPAATTPNEFVTFGAGFHLSLPDCEATIETVPVPVKVRFVPPEIVAGPLPTANETNRPELAVADKRTTLVVVWDPIAGKVMVWSERLPQMAVGRNAHRLGTAGHPLVSE